MFTKEKLKKWIITLSWVISAYELEIKENKKKENPVIDLLNLAIEETKKTLEDLKNNLEKLHTSITSDGSI